MEATVIEHLILGAFLVIPLLIVAFLFSDELRHPLRRSRHRV
jgi:hypothetical protein